MSLLATPERSLLKQKNPCKSLAVPLRKKTTLEIKSDSLHAIPIPLFPQRAQNSSESKAQSHLPLYLQSEIVCPRKKIYQTLRETRINTEGAVCKRSSTYKCLGSVYTRQPDGGWKVAQPVLGEGFPSEGLWVQTTYWKELSPGFGIKTTTTSTTVITIKGGRTPGVITLGLKSAISLDPWILISLVMDC